VPAVEEQSRGSQVDGEAESAPDPFGVSQRHVFGENLVDDTCSRTSIAHSVFKEQLGKSDVEESEQRRHKKLSELVPQRPALVGDVAVSAHEQHGHGDEANCAADSEWNRQPRAARREQPPGRERS